MFFREVGRLGCGLAIVNARISDRAIPRYRNFAPIFSTILSLCDRILVQSDEMRDRFEAAGAPPDIIRIAGNLKYDFAPATIDANSPALRFIEAARGRPFPEWPGRRQS